MDQIADLPAVISSYPGYGAFERTLREKIQKGEPAAIPIKIRPYVPVTKPSDRTFLQEPLKDVKLGSGLIASSGTIIPPAMAAEESESLSEDRAKWTLIHDKADWVSHFNTCLSAQKHHNINLEFTPQYLTKIRYGDLEIPQVTLILEYLAKPKRTTLSVDGSAEHKMIQDAVAAQDVQTYQAEHGDHFIESYEEAVIATAIWVFTYQTYDLKMEAIASFSKNRPRDYPAADQSVNPKIVNGKAVGMASPVHHLEDAWSSIDALSAGSRSADGWMYSSNSTAETLDLTGPHSDASLRAELRAHIASEEYTTSCIWVKPLPVGGVLPRPVQGHREAFWLDPLKDLFQAYAGIGAYETDQHSMSAGSNFYRELDKALQTLLLQQKNILGYPGVNGRPIVSAALESQSLTTDLDAFQRSDTKRRCKQYWLETARTKTDQWYKANSNL